MIVGQPFTYLPGIVLIQKKEELQIFKESHVEIQDLATSKSGSLGSSVPPNEAADVKVIVGHITYERELFVDLSIRSKPNKEHCIPPCIIDTDSGLLPIVNLSDPLEIKKLRIVARAEPVSRENIPHLWI